MIVRRLQAPDLARVAALSDEAFPEPHESANRVDVPGLREELARPIARVFVLEAEQDLHGFFIGWLVADELQIHTVAVAVAVRKQGHATAFLKRVLLTVGAEGARIASLELRAGNRAAYALYTRLGFHEVGQRKSYYANGETAVLMQYDFAASAP